MTQKINELIKLDQALVPQALNNTNVTGVYFKMHEADRALFLLLGGAMAAAKTSKIEVFQAKDAAGTGGALITGKSATITANTAVTKMTIALATVLANQTVTINGITFTAHASTTTAANREFSIGGTDTADGDELASLINDATYGVPGVTASNNAGTLTLTVDEPGETVLTASASDSTFTIATVEALAFVEILAEHLDHENGFTHVAAKVTTTANTVVAVALLRGDVRYTPDQQVGASTT